MGVKHFVLFVSFVVKQSWFLVVTAWMAIEPVQQTASNPVFFLFRLPPRGSIIVT